MPPRSEPALNEAAIRELAGEILERPEYAKYREPDSEAWRIFVDSLVDWLSELPRLHDEAPALYWTVVSLLSLVLIALVTHIVWTVTAALRLPQAPKAAVEARTELDFAAEAARLAQRGAYLEGAHQLLLASLAHAARAQLVELRAADGNHSICNKLRDSRVPSELRERLITLIESTEASWFGARSDDPELYERWRAAYAELRRSAA
jgi:hypothetical protein